MVPRLALWRIVAEAILAGELKVTYSKKWRQDGSPPGPKWMEWFLKIVKTDQDPNAWGGSQQLRLITVDKRQFDAWLRRATKAPTGPRRGASGYASADRKHFPAIRKLIKKGEARSVYGAALMLAEQGTIKGASPKSAAQRVTSLYKREEHR
jgi:hypothetical protein